MNRINKTAIKTALQAVHDTERSASNPTGLSRARAIEHILQTGPALSTAELDILLSALHAEQWNRREQES